MTKTKKYVKKSLTTGFLKANKNVDNALAGIKKSNTLSVRQAALAKLLENQKYRIRGAPINSPQATNIKQKKMMEHWLSTNMKSLSKSAAVVGYNPDSTAAIIRTKTWKALMNEYLPDDLLAERHNELLNKRDIKMIKQSDGSMLPQDFGPDVSAVTKSLEMAYKLKGAFTPNVNETKNGNIYNLIYKPEVRASIKSFEDMLKAQLYGENKGIMGATEIKADGAGNDDENLEQGGGGSDEGSDGNSDTDEEE